MESDDGSPLSFEEWTGDCKLWQHAVCGSAAGVMEHVLLFPIDTLKTRLQCGWCKPEAVRKACSAERTLGSCMRSKQQSHLWRQLYRGCNVMAVGCVPAHVLYFTGYEAMKKVVNVPLAGALATFCHDVILTPADVVKQRLQLGSYRGSLHCIGHLLKREGIKSFYRSLPVTLFMNMPYHAILVGVNDLLLKNHSGGSNNCSFGTYFLYAGIGGAVAGALTNPIDVIKTHLQTQQCFRNTNVGKPLYTNPVNTAQAVYREHGFRGFWRGAAISWGTYSTLKNMFRKFNNG